MRLEWADVARLRQGIYRFTSIALLPPSDDIITSLLASGFYLADQGTSRYPYHTALQRLIDGLPDAEIARVKVEYVRLLASGSDGAVCPPIESFHVADVRTGAASRVTSVVQRSYARAGVMLTATGAEPDHLATELEFMSLLCGRECEALSRGDEPTALATMEEEERFLENHPTRWVPRFRERVRESHHLRFYDDVVALAHAFIIHDLDQLRAVRGETLAVP